MMNHAARWISPLDRHFESVNCELTVDLLRYRPSNDFARVQVQNDRKIDKSRVYSDVSQVDGPNLIYTVNRHFLNEIGMNLVRVIGVSRRYKFFLWRN
jgi:hypothetical protein